MSTEPEFGSEDSHQDSAGEQDHPSVPSDFGSDVLIVGGSNNIGLQQVAGLVTALGATVTAASVTLKAKIEAGAEVRKAEIEAETRRLEITEETKREEMRLQADQQVSAPAEGE